MTGPSAAPAQRFRSSVPTKATPAAARMPAQPPVLFWIHARADASALEPDLALASASFCTHSQLELKQQQKFPTAGMLYYQHSKEAIASCKRAQSRQYRCTSYIIGLLSIDTVWPTVLGRSEQRSRGRPAL